jgi:hypothetical protein
VHVAHAREDLPDLAALQLADEVPGQLGVRGRLGLEVLRAVLASQRDAGLGQRADVLERDVLRRGEDLDAGAHLRAHLLEVRPHAGGV